MTFFETLADRARKRALYHQTVAEIKAMPRDVALDLDIFHEDAEKIAQKAVYGR